MERRRKGLSHRVGRAAPHRMSCFLTSNAAEGLQLDEIDEAWEAAREGADIRDTGQTAPESERKRGKLMGNEQRAERHPVWTDAELLRIVQADYAVSYSIGEYMYRKHHPSLDPAMNEDPPLKKFFRRWAEAMERFWTVVYSPSAGSSEAIKSREILLMAARRELLALADEVLRVETFTVWPPEVVN